VFSVLFDMGAYRRLLEVLLPKERQVFASRGMDQTGTPMKTSVMSQIAPR